MGRAAWRGPSVADVCCAAILALNLTWCSLEGHAQGFVASTIAVDVAVNSRAFWLIGLCLAGAVFVGAPGWAMHRDRVIRWIVPSLGCVGTLAFAWASQQELVSPFALAATGLVLCGLCHFWTSARAVLLEARTARFSNIVGMLVMAILIKTIVLIVAPTVLPGMAQVWFAAAIPLANLGLFELARRDIDCRARALDDAAASRIASADADRSAAVGAEVRTVFGVPCLPRGEDPGRRSKIDYVLLTIMAGFLLATIRRLSFWGMWGVTATFPMTYASGAAQFFIVAIVLGAFAWLALIKTQGLSNTFRFQPAVIVVVAGLFLAAVELPAGWEAVGDALIQADEACAYVLFWSAAAVSLDVQRIRSLRLLGLSGLAFGASSLLWVVMGRFFDDIGGAFVALAAYAVIVMAMVFVYREAKQDMQRRMAAVERRVEHEAQVRAVAQVADGLASGAGQGEDAAVTPLADSIAERCTLLAEEYHLTARESVVLQLLAQGRTRAYIQKELVLSDSTVKTHVSHIYAKLGVRNRQGLMDLVLSPAD